MRLPHTLATYWQQWHALSINSFLLMASVSLSSVLGFVFWSIAANTYDSALVGLGAAYIAALTLLAKLGELGLGITLVRFVRSLASQTVIFVNTCLIAVTGATFLVTLVFLWGVPLWSPELADVLRSPAQVLLFIVAVVSFRAAEFIDQLYVAFEVPQYLLARNLIASLLRIVLLVACGRQMGVSGLLFAFGGAAFITFGISIVMFVPTQVRNYRLRPEFHWPLLIEKARYSIGNHFSQLLWNVLPLLYPLLVVTLLGPEANAYFYINWMIANVLFLVPIAVSTAAFASASENRAGNAHALGSIMHMTLLGLVPIVVVTACMSEFLLGLFGYEYIQTPQHLLYLLLISAFPYTINTFVIVEFRIRQQIKPMVWFSGTMAILSCMAMAIFGSGYGVNGLGVGWLISQGIGALIVILYQNSPSNSGVAHEQVTY